jgi:hypothetical protein
MGVETLLYFFVICYNTRSENRHYIQTKNSKYAVHLASVFFSPGTFHLKLHGCGRRAGHDPSRGSGVLPRSIFGTLDHRCGAVHREQRGRASTNLVAAVPKPAAPGSPPSAQLALRDAILQAHRHGVERPTPYGRPCRERLGTTPSRGSAAMREATEGRASAARGRHRGCAGGQGRREGER